MNFSSLKKGLVRKRISRVVLKVNWEINYFKVKNNERKKKIRKL